jgi:hypothetical protein
MSELRKAVSVLEVLERYRKAGKSGWAYYSPGDATKYRVHLIEAVPVHVKPVEEAEVTRILLVQVETNELNPKSILIHEPYEWSRFTPEMWLNLGLPVGWWRGVRPLLAALGWAEPGFESVEFNDADSADIDYADRQRRVRVGAARAW